MHSNNELNNDFLIEEEDKLAKEGEMLGGEVQEQQLDLYNEKDYIYERNEWDNCIHEYVAPQGYMRPEFKRPQETAKEYKFKLDKF